MVALSFDEFLESKNSGRAYYICLLEDELSYLDGEYNLLSSAPFNTYLVTLNEEEFNMLHIGKHPKILLYDNGKEIWSHNGIPEYEVLLENA